MKIKVKAGAYPVRLSKGLVIAAEAEAEVQSSVWVDQLIRWGDLTLIEDPAPAKAPTKVLAPPAAAPNTPASSAGSN